MQNFNLSAARPQSEAFNFTEELELDCVDRNSSQDYNRETNKSRLYYRANVNCTCDPAVDDTCFYCENSGRFYQLRFRQGMQLPIREPNFTLYMRDSKPATFATTMGLLTTVTLQVSCAQLS